MDRTLRLERLLIGLRGLGLLRRWPLGDPDAAERELAEMATMLQHRDEPPMSDLIAVREFDLEAAYAEWAETYDGENALVDVEEPVVRSILADVPKGRALDVACGTGRLTSILCELGHDVVAVDPSEAMLAKARAKGLPATFVDGRCDALPIEDGSVDVLTCALALTHLRELAPAAGEFARVVRPGGVAVVSDIHPIATATGGQAWFSLEDGSRGLALNHLHWVSDYVHAFHDAGFALERCEEPLVTDAFLETLSTKDVRTAFELGVVGLPFALILAFRRTGDASAG